MIALVFCFDRQPHGVHAVRDAYRMSEVLPPPFDVCVLPDDCSVAWNAHCAFLAPKGSAIPADSRCSMAALLEGCHSPDKSVILSALLHRYLVTHAEDDNPAELAVVLVPDQIAAERDPDITAAALMAGFRRCVVLRSLQALKAAFSGLSRTHSVLALHSSQVDARATLLGAEARDTTIPLSDLLSRTAIGARLAAHAARIFSRGKSERFLCEAVQVLVTLWLQAGSGSAMVWSASDREPLRVSLDREALDSIDRDLLATLEPLLALEADDKAAVAVVYSTGPMAAGICRIAALLLPDAQVECDFDAHKLVRAAAFEGSARQDRWRGSSLVVHTTGARVLGRSSSEKLVTKLGRGIPEFTDQRFQFQSVSTKMLSVETDDQQPVTLCELTPRGLDERRGWGYFAVRILTDDTRIFACEIEIGRKGMLQMVILDRATSTIRRIDSDRIRRVRMA